jgi:flagellar basal body rod protein FlgG
LIQAFYTARSGALSFQSDLDVTAANLANVGTTGYKEQKAYFSELLYTTIASGEETDTLKAGSGVRTADVAALLDQGALEQTGRSLDAAIQGEGYFALMDAQGNVSYTRSGSFRLADIDGTLTLVSLDGSRVLDGDLDEITLDEEQTSLVFASGESAGEGEISLGIFTFANPYALGRTLAGGYVATEQSGEAEAVENPVVIQGALEQSNVDTIAQMQTMITAQRGFQMNARVIQTADELEQTANNLRG